MLISDFVRNNGIAKKHIARCCGLDPDTVTNRLQGIGDWRVIDLIGLSQALRLPQAEIVKMIFEEERYKEQILERRNNGKTDI